jgi:hypothetical protein
MSKILDQITQDTYGQDPRVPVGMSIWQQGRREDLRNIKSPVPPPLPPPPLQGKYLNKLRENSLDMCESILGLPCIPKA